MILLPHHQKSPGENDQKNYRTDLKFLRKLVQSNFDYPDYSIIQTFFSGPNFLMNINKLLMLKQRLIMCAFEEAQPLSEEVPFTMREQSTNFLATRLCIFHN